MIQRVITVMNVASVGKKEKPDTTRIKVTQTWPIQVSRNAVARTEPTETGQNRRRPRKDGDGKDEHG